MKPAGLALVSFIIAAGYSYLMILLGRKNRSAKKNLRVEFVFSVQEKKPTVQNKPMNTVKLTTVQLVSITAVFEASNGQPVAIVGTPVWASTDPTIATVTPSADGLTATVESVGPGTATITVTGEGDAIPGKDTVTDGVIVTVVAAEATQVVLNVGTPTDKPVAAPAPVA